MKKEMDQLAGELKKQLAGLGKDKSLNRQVDETLKQAGQGLTAEAESATVDFAAKTSLSKENKKQKFINPDYELKPLQWKLMYRAGKPAVDAARAAAQEWLKALGA